MASSVSSTTSGTISVGGLASGLDTESIVSQLVALERKPITNLQKKEANYQVQLTAYGTLQGTLSSLNTAASALDKVSDFNIFKASSADPNIFTVSADSNAVKGSYNITVHNIAQVQKLTSSGFGKTESVGAGTLTIQVGTGDAMTVDVAAGDTIQNVANAINAQKGDVSANVISDGTNSYLTLTSENTGTANTIKITVNDTGDSNNTDTNGLSRLAYEKGVTENTTMTQTQEALDALIDVDGVTGIKRSSNTLEDVITGVTIDLLKAHDTPATQSTKLTVSRDTSAITSAVDKFISAYNDVVNLIKTDQSYDSDTKTGGTLLGDSTLKLIERRLSSLFNSRFSGMGSISSLSDLGITRKDDGTLTVSSATLTKKLNTNYNDVVQFFTQTTTGKEGFSVRLKNELDGILNSTDGVIVAKQKGIQKSIDGIEEDITQIDARATMNEERIRAQFNALEALISNYQTTGNYLTQQLTSLQNLNTAISNK